MAPPTSSDFDEAYELNLRQAYEGTEAWIKVSKLATMINHEDLAKLLVCYGYAPHQFKHLCLRNIDSPLGSVCVRTPFAAIYKVVWAIHHDGTYPDTNETAVAYCVLPTHGLSVALELGAQLIVKEGEYVSFTVGGSDIKEVTIARMPRLSVADDPEMEEYDQYFRAEDLQDSAQLADCKERECAGCGAIWRKTMPRCSKCSKARFCSQACLAIAWPDHKHECRAHQNK